MKIKKYSHIPEIVLFKEIKQFFKLFQTRETEDRVDRLEKAILRWRSSVTVETVRLE